MKKASVLNSLSNAVRTLAMMRGEALEKSMFFMSDPDWYYYLDEDDDEQFPLLTDKAPPEAVESYNYAKKLFEEHKRTGILI